MNDVKILYQKYQDLFDFSENTIEKSHNFLVGEKAATLEKQVTLFHFARAVYLLDAIYRLCAQGFATEAMVILRSLLNLYINIKWLTSGDSKKSFERFAEFEVVFKKLAIEAVIKYGTIKDEIKNDNLNIHDKEFDRVMKKYNLGKKRDLFCWSGKSLFRMATDVNLEKEYSIIYSKLSSMEHTGPESVKNYLEHSEERGFTIKAGPRDENIDLVLVTALEYYFKVQEITRKIFGLDCSALENDVQIFLELQNKYWVNNKKAKKVL